MNKFIFSSLGLAAGVTLAIGACTSKSVPVGVNAPYQSRYQDRLPAASVETIGDPDAEVLAQMTSQEQFKYNISTWIRYYIIFGGHAQKIVASFDEKLKEGLASTDRQDIDRIKTALAEIDCQVMELNSLSHEMEDNIRIIYKAVLDRKDPALTDWFLERLAVAPGYDTVPQIMARLSYVRVVKAYHDSICQDNFCRQANFSKRRLRFPFDPFSDQEALDYKKANNKAIALFFANPISKQESCISRSPAAAVPGTNYFGGNMPEGSFAVTYDDGPHEKYTMPILNSWLEANLPKPTFFWLGKEAVKYPQIVKAVAKSGAEVACHSYSHPDMGNIAKAQSYDDLNRTNVDHFFPKGQQPSERFQVWKDRTIKQEFSGAIGNIEGILAAAPASPQTRIAKFRFPYGSGYNNPALLEMVKARGMVHIHWKIDSLDWQDKNPLSIMERVQGQMKFHKKGIILFHDIHPQSAEASKLLIKFFKSQNQFKVDKLEKAL